MADDLELEDTTQEETTEPLGAQILRRFHEDHGILMEDYHNLMGALEQTDVKDYMTGYLENVEENMSMTEEMFGKLYPDLPGLTGGKDMEGSEDSDMEVTEDDLTDDEETPEEVKDIDTAGTGSVGSDSGAREENAPDGDEVLEGMESDEKSLYGKSRMMKVLKRLGKKNLPSKRKCADCGNPNCSCGKQLTAEQATTADEPMSETTDPARPSSAALHTKALEGHEKPIVSEAAQHLKQLSESPGMDQEARFKSYHYHKQLENLSGMTGMKDHLPGDAETERLSDPNQPIQKGVRDVTPDMEDLSPDEDDDGKSMHHHRKTMHTASQFLKALAYSKDFGDPHRMEALTHHKALDEISRDEQPQETPAEQPVEDTPEPGEMGEKALDMLKAMVLEQEKTISKLTNSLSGIASKL